MSFLEQIKKFFWFENAHTSGPEAIGGTQRAKTRSTARFYGTQNHQKSEVNKVYTLICFTDYVSLVMTGKKIAHHES